MKKPTNFSLRLLLCLSFTSSIDNQQRKKDNKILSSSLFLPCTDERTKRRSQEDKRETAFRTKPWCFIIILLKFVRAQKRVRILFCPALSVVSRRSPPFLSSSSNVMMREKEVYTRAREKIRI